jgi:hypothetical protein
MMIGVGNLGTFSKRLSQHTENGRFQVAGMGSPSQHVTYIPANEQGTEQFSHAMSVADDLSRVMKRSGDLAQFAKNQDAKPNSQDLNPESGKVVMARLSEDDVDTGFADKPRNEFTATSLDFDTDKPDAGSNAAKGFGLQGVQSLTFGYLEKYTNGRASDDPAKHETLQVNVKRSVDESLLFGIRQGDESLGLNVSPTGALTVL